MESAPTCTHSAGRNEESKLLLELRVLRSGLFQDRDVGIGVFPEREEVLVCGKSSDTGGDIAVLRCSHLQSISPCHTQMRHSSCPAIPDDAPVVENLLELCGSLRSLSSGQI